MYFIELNANALWKHRIRVFKACTITEC